MKKILLGALALFSMNTFGQNVNIPDANFKNALLAHGASAPVNGVNPITGFGISLIDANNDGDISTTEAQNYTGTINVGSKSISDLTGIEAFVSITILYCHTNQLTSVDVSANTALTDLYCNHNQLTSLDVSNNTNLTGLGCGSNVLNTLDVSANISLLELACENNQMNSLDVSTNTALTALYCNNNQLTSLDVSANTALKELYCNNNQLTSLNVANGNNGTSSTDLSQVIANNNPNLTCIQHDTGFDPTTTFDWSKDATASWSTNCSGSSCANIVNIPDANFKNALINHSPTIDTDGDGEICQTEAQAFTGTINVYNKSISDLTGIEAFVNLTKLYCSANQLTSLDVSANTALTELGCNNNQLTSLDVSVNTALTKLYCHINQLTSLDVSYNTALTHFDCYNNQLSSLDVSVNTVLTELDCSNNQLTNLNLANGNNGMTTTQLNYVSAIVNPNLTCIQHDTGFDPTTATDWQKDATASWSDNCPPVSSCNNIVNIPDANFKAALLDHGVGITTAGVSVIDTDGDGEICQTEAQAYIGAFSLYNLGITDLTGIEAFPGLTDLYCEANQLTSLDLSSNLNLITVYCTANQITELDVSANTQLQQLLCGNNQLTSLNVANGNNGTNFTNLNYVNATGNTNLTCIQHDTGFDPTTATNWTKEASTSWSTNCSGSTCANIVNIPDANFKAALLDHGVGITTTGVSVIDTDGDGEICETEAQAYTGLIDVYGQNISDLTGIEAFVNTTILYCHYNQLTNIDVSANTALTELRCYNNQLSSLNISTNTALVYLYCENNQIGSLDVSSNTALRTIHCQDNQINSLNVSSNSALTSVYCQNNQLNSLNVANGINGTTSSNLYGVNATNNPNLTCIQHDTGFDPTTANQWQKDATAQWSDNCSGSSSGINENNISFSIVPNPTSGMVKIDTEVEISSVEILSTSGQKVASFETKAFDISALQSGVYFVKVLSDGGSFTTRIIRE